MTTENGKLAVRLIRLTNIGGLRGTLEIPLGDVTYIEGTNGVGKSSAIDGLAALCGAPVTDLLTQGEREGEAYAELTDDTWFRRRITADGKNILTAGHPEQGSIGKAAAWMKATLSIAALSPAEFLNADDEKAAEHILRTTPMTVTAKEVGDAIGQDLGVPTLNTQGHALVVLDRAIKVLYDMRTGENRAAKDARATAEQLQRSIPEDAPSPKELAETAERLAAELAELAGERAAAEERAALEAHADADAAIRAVDEEIKALAAGIARLEAQLASMRRALDETEERKDGLVKDRDNSVHKAEIAAGSAFQERQAALTAELASARQAHAAAEKAEAAIQNTRAIILQQEAIAEVAHKRSTALTAAMARLDALKVAKAAELPIDGVSIEGGKLFIDGVPAHRANTARRMRVAAAASAAQDTRIRFIIADDLEHLSTKTRREVEQWCREEGIQVLGARVTDDEELMVHAADGVPTVASVRLDEERAAEPELAAATQPDQEF